MAEWLSSTWGASWKSFQYFNLYRLVVAIFLLGMGQFSGDWLKSGHSPDPRYFQTIALAYVLTSALGIALSVKWQAWFNRQLSCQVLADVVAVSLLMNLAGGLSSGLGVLLLVSLAAASLVGRGRLVLFYAALGSLGVMSQQIYGVWIRNWDLNTVFQAGLLSAGFFATAILARLLGQRTMANEELARRRGIALENQRKINQRVIERMQDGVLVVTRSGRVQRHNPEAENMLGVSRPEGVLLAEYSVELGELFGAWLDRRGVDSIEFSGPNDSTLHARFEPTESSDGEVLIFLEDVGRIQEQAQQLKLAALGRLTASIAHEIRNPLSAISHAGDLLREERRIESQDRLLRILGDNVTRLDRIVRDILELGRRDRTQPENIDLHAFIRNFVDEFVEADSSAFDVVALDVAANASIDFDRSHLRQILWNLTANALRHSLMMPGSVRLQASGADGEGRVELHVMDDGPGVPEHLRAQVFEPFFTTHHKGSGLGLFIARELCDVNSASLTLAPTAGGGHFVITGRTELCRAPDPNVAFAAN